MLRLLSFLSIFLLIACNSSYKGEVYDEAIDYQEYLHKNSKDNIWFYGKTYTKNSLIFESEIKVDSTLVFVNKKALSSSLIKVNNREISINTSSFYSDNKEEFILELRIKTKEGWSSVLKVPLWMGRPLFKATQNYKDFFMNVKDKEFFSVFEKRKNFNNFAVQNGILNFAAYKKIEGYEGLEIYLLAYFGEAGILVNNKRNKPLAYTLKIDFPLVINRMKSVIDSRKGGSFNRFWEIQLKPKESNFWVNY